MARFGKGLIDYLQDDFKGRWAETIESVRCLVADALTRPGLDLGFIKWALGVFRRCRDFEVVELILKSEQVSELLPKSYADFLLAVGPIGDSAVEVMMNRLLSPRGERTEGRDLHAIRAVGQEGLGLPEGKVLFGVALDRFRPSPTRSWAMTVAARTPVARVSDIGDIVLDEAEDLFVRRAAVLSLRDRTGPSRDSLLRHSALRQAGLGCAALWAAA
jgi:hypothetical protein